MVALARDFPGALREIDDLELDEIRRRILKLDAVLSGSGDREPWMGAVALFHRFMRGALSAKRWLAGRKQIDGALEQEFAEAASTLEFPSDALVWAGHLAGVASPPGGHLTELVYSRMARALGITRAEAKRLVFGPANSRRRRSG
jgi:hypothetical protein